MQLCQVQFHTHYSYINFSPAQAFNGKTKKDSSDGDDTGLDYGDEERASVLPNEEDEEDEETAEGDVVTPVITEGDGVQATLLQIQARLSVKTWLIPKKTRMTMMMTRKPLVLEMALFCMIQQFFQQEESAKVHQTMYPSE